MRPSTYSLLVLALLPLASSFLTAPMQTPSLRLPTRAGERSLATLRMQEEGSRRSVLASALGASLAFLAPREASAGGLASLRESITGEKKGEERAAIRQKVSQTKNPCDFYNCVPVDEDLFKAGGVSKTPKEVAPGVTVRVPEGWTEVEASGNTALAFEDGKGARVSVIKSGDGYIKLKDVEGQPAPVASAGLKLDLIQVGNRLVKLFGAESYTNGAPRFLTPQNLLVYAIALKAEEDTILLSVAQSQDKGTSWIVSCRCKTDSIKRYKQTFGAVLQSIAIEKE